MEIFQLNHKRKSYDENLHIKIHDGPLFFVRCLTDFGRIKPFFWSEQFDDKSASLSELKAMTGHYFFGRVI
jgi:hypothetical protein